MLVLRVVGGVLALLVGAAVAGGTAMVGHCSAFGGRCPSPSGLEGDVYGGIAIGVVLAVGGPMVAWRPDRRGMLVAVVVAGLCALLAAAVLGPYLRGEV